MKLWFERGAYASRKGREIAATIEPTEVKKIAVIRHAALGDMVIARPFLKELRQFFPNAEITLSLTSHYTYGAPTDLVDKIHTVYGADQRQVPKMEQLKRIKELGEQDIIFDLAATSRSFQLSVFNKAKLKVGFPYKPIQNFLYYDVGILRTDFRFEAEVLLDCLNIFGHKAEYPLNFSLPVCDKANASKRIVYFFGASGKSKCYPDNSMIAVIDQLAQAIPDYEHVILEGINPDEKADEALKKLAQHNNVSHQPTLSLEEVTDWLADSRLVVCNDTGVRNLAISTHTPTLGIFFSTVPYRYWPKYENHYASFNADGSIPAVDDVAALAQRAIQENYSE